MMGENVAITIVKLLDKTDNIITILAVTPTAFILCISSRATHTYSSASRIYLTILLGINFKHLLWLCLFLSPPQENRRIIVESPAGFRPPASLPSLPPLPRGATTASFTRSNMVHTSNRRSHLLIFPGRTIRTLQELSLTSKV